MNANNRKEAEANHKANVIALRKAEDVSESAWLVAKANHQISLEELVFFQINFPTSKEYAKRENILNLRNRGLDC